ncbi:MAG TPA: ATP-binding protein, partial [Burkholderiaceae bacterium]|nr:ATP-binding protein [Burkholderiaceae bacterium]
RLAEQAQRLEALDRSRSRLLADVSHELRTPVMLVSLPLRDLHKHAGTLTAADRRRLELALKQLDRLGGLVEQLVGLVQAEVGQARPRFRRLDLAALLHEIAAGYQPAAEQVGATLVVRASGTDVALFGDRDHLTTVFGNLVDNAIKHAPRGSAVTLGLEYEDACAVIRIQDQGTGFDAATGARLFERFYRAEGPPRQGREGLGIGLALARELVELHGGRITAGNTPGSGATFRVELPLGTAHVAIDDIALDQAIGAPLPMLPSSRGDGRVLLVEDHPDLAAYLAERLGEHLPVTCVGSAEQAAQVLADEPGIRVVVSDVVLPGASGLDLCRQLTRLPRERQRPVILISAKAADTDRDVGLAAGAVTYLAKPFSFETLLNELARAWPEAAPRLVANPLDPVTLDPLLAIALGGLGDSEFVVGGWATQAHLSERQLRRRVGELTGQSPQTWLREQRLLRVRHLLRSGACKTLVEAGARCGLDNPAWLYRSYRARFGE